MRRYLCFLWVLFVLQIAATAEEGFVAARPHQILIIRHAEKPPDDDPSVHLDEAGKKRAAALPKLFIKSAERPLPFPKPDFIFAAQNSAKSHRPSETVAPLATSLEMTVNLEFENEHEHKLTKEIFDHKKYAGKTILISWHHGSIPDLAKKLGVANVPEHWHKLAFDRVWVISYDTFGNAALSDLPQRLLPGDAEK